MNNLTQLVKRKFFKLLPDRFTLVLEKQMTPNAHYVAVFASSSDGDGHRAVCLALSSMEGETTQEASEHIRFMELVLHVIGKCLSKVAAFVWNNFANNRLISNSLEIFFIGYVLHRS